MSKKKMQEAQRLIKAKDYDGARKILRTVDHPKAREWEARLDKIAPAAPRRLPLVPIIIVAVLVVVVVALALLLLNNNNAAPQIADEPTQAATVAVTSPADAATPTAEISDGDEGGANNNPPPQAMDRPARLPAEFPFPAGGFTEVFDLSEDEDINISVYSEMSYAELESYYREALAAAGYEFLDFSSGSAVILSFLGHGMLGNVRLTQDGPDGQTRITVEMEATTASGLDDLAPGNSQVVASDVRYDTPESAAQAFLTAIADGDSVTALALICEANKVGFNEETYLSMLPSASIPGGRLDVSRLDYDLLEAVDGVAQVSIMGEVIEHVTVNDLNTTDPVPLEEPIVMELHLMDGWQVCTL